jgi:hypothetical protein
MRDKKDNATFDLPGFEPAASVDANASPEGAKRTVGRPRTGGVKQEQLALVDLDAVDATGLPVWQRDPNLDVTGLPVWQPST